MDTTGLVSFPPPQLHARYWFAQEWAQEASGTMVIAMVARAEMIGPQRFGVLAARNAGLRSFVLASECEALAWLLAEAIG